MEIYLTTVITVLFTLTFALSFYFMVVYGYNLFISVFGYKNLKKDYEMHEDETKFLLLVAAHNEEAVIDETIQNLKKIDYSPELFDICIVSDNSTDNTTNIAESHKVMVIDTIQKRFKREGVGKPAGIQYALREIGFENVQRNYDLIMVLDADNFVDEHILKEVNSQYIEKEKPEAIQTYLDTKNYGKISSLSYSVIFWTNNRFMQAAKYRLGLPNSIGGTGFCIRTDWLINNGGFKFKSLTEDLEMEIEIVKNGGRILWNDFAGVYDEKPEKTKVSMVQRHRWIKGHWYVAFKQTLPLLFKFLTTFKLKYLDKVFFLLSMGKALHVVLITVLLSFIGILFISTSGVFHVMLISDLKAVWNIANEYYFYIYGINIFLILYSFGVLPIYSTYKKMGKHNPLKVFIAVQWFVFTDLIVQIIGLFTWPRQGVWVATPHEKTQIENDMDILALPETFDTADEIENTLIASNELTK